MRYIIFLILFSSFSFIYAFLKNFLFLNVFFSFLCALILSFGLFYLIYNFYKKFYNEKNAELFAAIPFISFFGLYFHSIFNINYPFSNSLGYLKYVIGFVYICFIFCLVFTNLFLILKNKIHLNTKIIFIICFSFLLLINIPAYFQGLNGDETEYILNIHSIYNDFDFNLKNQISLLDFNITGRTTPASIPLLKYNNSYVSMHNYTYIFYAVLLIPFIILKRIGAHLVINLFMSSFICLFFSYINRIINFSLLKRIILLISILTSPTVIFYSFHIYPESLSALLIFIVFLILENKDLHKKQFILLSLICFALIWVNIRLSVFFAPVLIILLLYHFNPYNKKYFLFILFSIAISIFLFILLSNKIPNQFTATKPSEFDLKFYRRLFGLFFDGEFGFFIFNPVFLIFTAGIFFIHNINFSKIFYSEKSFKKILHTKSIFKKIVFSFFYNKVFLFIVFYLGSLCFVSSDWYGGKSPATRFLVVCLPFIFILFSLVLYELKKFFQYLLLLILLLIQAGAAMAYSFIPKLRAVSSYPIGKNSFLSHLDYIYHINIKIFPYFSKNSTMFDYLICGLIILFIFFIFFNKKSINNF